MTERLSTCRSSILLQVVLVVLLALCLVSPSRADPTQPINTIIPAYPLDAAGCSALNVGGKFTVDLVPAATKYVSGPNLRFSAFLVPDTPVLRFLAYNEFTFARMAVIPLDPRIQCFKNATYGADKILHFADIPAGKYIVLEKTSELVSYVGDDEGTTDEPEPGANGSIEIVPRISHTPVLRQYERKSLFGIDVTISPNGRLTMSSPQSLLTQGY